MPLYFFILAPISLAYSAVTTVRAALYRAGVFKVKRLPCKVVSVGNLAAGGTGKTPFTIHIARLIAERGLKAAIVTRGYRGSAEGAVKVVSDGQDVVLGPDEAGDEAVLLAKHLPGVPVIMGSDRYRAGMLAVERFKAEVVILDDGYQHIALGRDLNILLLDAAHPFGNGFTLPMGYLREPRNAFNRADLVVLTRYERVSNENYTLITDLQPLVPLLKTMYIPQSLYSVWDGQEARLENLKNEAVLAVSGIAAPGSFTLILQKLNVKIAGTMVYPDHHGFNPDDLRGIEVKASGLGVRTVIVTEKDAVKLSRLTRPENVRFLALKIGMEIVEGAGTLKGLLDKRIAVR